MISPEKKEEDKTVIGQDLFKYEGDRIEKVGAKDWMEPLTGISAWRPLIIGISGRLARQMDYRKAEVELRSNFAADTYELIVKYEDGSVKIQPIDPMAELVSI